MSTPVLHVEHVTMQFGGVVAVNDLSMDVYDREIVALIGPNGAGKTTAFNCITGVYEPTNGKLKAVGLDDVKDELATALPYGKQRRLEIARALATDPKLLLLDEPAAGMNPQETIELTNFIRSVRDEFGLTIFLIEHHMNLVMDISDRIYVIDFGKQIAAGVPAEIQNDQRVIDAYLGVDEDA